MAPRKQTCKFCGIVLASNQRLQSHYASNRNPCKSNTISEINPEAGPSTKRQRKEASSPQELANKDEIPKFEKTDLRYAGLEILDAHYRASIPEQASYSKDPISTLNILRPQMERIFYNRFKLTHGFKA